MQKGSFSILIAVIVVSLLTFPSFFLGEKYGVGQETIGPDASVNLRGDYNTTRESTDLVRAVLESPGYQKELFLPENSTVYDLMKQAQFQDQNFSFGGKEFSGLGFFVEEINGVSQNPKQGYYWIYYVNGKAASLGVSQYKIKNNDIINWRYEKNY